MELLYLTMTYIILINCMYFHRLKFKNWLRNFQPENSQKFKNKPGWPEKRGSYKKNKVYSIHVFMYSFNSLSHELWREWTNERSGARDRSEHAVQSEPMSERCEWTSKRASIRPCTLRVHVVVIFPNVQFRTDTFQDVSRKLRIRGSLKPRIIIYIIIWHELS